MERARPAPEEKQKVSKEEPVNDAAVRTKPKTRPKTVVPWRPVKSPLPGPGTYSIDRSKPSNVHSHGQWSLYSRRKVDRLYMPQYPEKDYGKFDAPFYEMPSTDGEGHQFPKEKGSLLEREAERAGARSQGPAAYDPGRSVSS